MILTIKHAENGVIEIREGESLKNMTDVEQQRVLMEALGAAVGSFIAKNFKTENSRRKALDYFHDLTTKMTEKALGGSV